MELYWWKRQVLCNLTEKYSIKTSYSPELSNDLIEQSSSIITKAVQDNLSSN
jgi:hypothetical protein